MARQLQRLVGRRALLMPAFDAKLLPELSTDAALVICSEALEATDLRDLIEPAVPKLALVHVGVHPLGSRPVGRVPSDCVYPVRAQSWPHEAIEVPK